LRRIRRRATISRIDLGAAPKPSPVMWVYGQEPKPEVVEPAMPSRGLANAIISPRGDWPLEYPIITMSERRVCYI